MPVIFPTRTLLSLSRYARIMGINPVTFQGATAGAIFPIRNACADLWWQFGWQNTDHVSRDDLAMAIYSAEVDMADFLGYWPAPVWTAAEEHPYPQGYRKAGLYSYSIGLKSVPLHRGKLLEFGSRAVSLVGTATVAGMTLVYSDEDADGFDETATITLPTTLTDACEMGAFFVGYGGDETAEIRSARVVTIAGGTLTMVFDSWLLIDPELQQQYPNSYDPVAIDLTDPASFVTSVEVYRIYTDTTTQGKFYWEPGIYDTCSGTGCGLAEQAACAYVRDEDTGLVVLQPGTYTNGVWGATAFNDCRDPDKVKIWYKSGAESQRYRAGHVCDPLGDDWAQLIAWIATARLERLACSCGNLTALFTKLQEDLAQSGQAGSYFLPEDIANNPFGTHRGEIEAYKRLMRLREARVFGAAL